MTFEKFSDFLAQLEQTSSRLKITEILANLLRQADSKEIDKICYLCLGQLAPLYAGIEFNLAEKMMIKALAQSFSLSEEEIKKRYKSLGDLGDVAAELKLKAQNSKLKTQSQNLNLTVGQVYGRLLEIAQEAGEGSVERKINKMAELLKSLDPLSVKYAVRIPLGRLRLGFSEITLMDALSWMLVGDKSKREKIEEAFNVRADIGQIAKIIKEKGIKGLKGIKGNLGVPIMPALCQRLPTAEEMIEKMAPRQARGKALVAVEPKFDGTRLQIHFSRKKKWEQKEDQIAFDFQPVGFVRTFTRNLENTTHMFPDLVKAVFEEVKASEAILDCEAISFDPKTGKFLPFQETIKRKRKYEVGQKAKEIPLKFFCFDILYKDGADLLKTPFNGRRKILEKVLLGKKKTIILTPQIATDNPNKLRKYHDEQKKKGLEGVVVKKWQEPYDPGRRGFTWVKFKEEETKKGGGLADTLDCVVMGYYKGKGKRSKFGIGAFLIGIKEHEDSDMFLTVSKVGTGLSDEQWREMYQRCEKIKVKERLKQYVVDKNLIPDVWCEPKIVVEIQADNITVSPVHTAGLALRFPRLVRFRDLKSPDQATTLAEAKKLYKLQGKGK